MATAWTAAQVTGIAAATLPAMPVLGAGDIVRVVPGLDLWDFWPVQTPDGAVAGIAGGELWFALSAAAEGEPALRHDRARLRLLRRVNGVWSDLGNALPDGLNPGSREWSGSAIVDQAGILTLFFTVAGRAGEARTTYAQRLFQTRAAVGDDGLPSGWSMPAESVASDGVDYVVADQTEGAIGTIKAFRDPGYFRDPADGASYLLFAASLARSASPFNGAVGIARAQDASLERWSLLPPLVHSDTLNNELERPHIVMRDGLYYLFWSTQGSVFAPGIEAPTGLYGMVAERLSGPYRPLNGTGLVLANPTASPAQAYSWLVLDDLRVTSFIDQLDSGRGGFGGAPAPELRLAVDGAKAWLART